jgi:hypothetical protein
MKSRLTQLLSTTFIGFTLASCAPAAVLAPKGTVPKRAQLEQDVFGSYITLKTIDSISYTGELIGVRNDSIVILSESAIGIPRKNISTARVIIHNPNDYRGAAAGLSVPGVLNFAHVGEFGAAPAALAISVILNNAIGLAAAQSTENKKINYMDWEEGWEKLVLYSRFPMGIPISIHLVDLKGRIIKK